MAAERAYKHRLRNEKTGEGGKIFQHVASIAISVVLALVHTFLNVETKNLLIGEAASNEMVAGVRKLIEAEAAQSCAIRRVHAIRAMHLGPNDVSRHPPALPRARHHGPGRAKLTCDAEELAAASADAEPIAFDDLGHRNILAPPVVRAIGAFLLCQHRALVAKHCGGLSVHGSDAKELSQVIAVPSIVR